MDPYLADPLTLASQVKVQGTWRSGRTIDLDAYLAQIQAVEAAAPRRAATHAEARRIVLPM